MTVIEMYGSRQESGVSEPSCLTGQPVKSAGEGRPSPDASAAGVLPERFAVEVTADDIEQGWPCSGSKCPIALAVMRWLWERRLAFVAVTVTDRDVEIISDWRTPAQRWWHDASSFTVMFDEGDCPEPRTVVLARLPR